MNKTLFYLRSRNNAKDERRIFLYYEDMDDKRVRICRVGWFYCAADWSWETRGSSQWPGYVNPCTWNYDLWTVLQGTGTLQTQQQTFDLSSGDCFILCRDNHYIGHHDPKDPLVVVAVHFDYLDTDGNVVRLPDVRLYRRIHQLEFFIHLLERLEKLWHASQIEQANVWLQACLAEIDQQDAQAEWHGYKRQQAVAIDEICRDIRTHPEKPYRVEDLAGKLNCTRRHFSRLFKQISGVAPQDFIVRARIEAAKGFLHASSYSVARIAELTGYRDACFFSRQFKHETGVSPTNYRKHYSADLC